MGTVAVCLQWSTHNASVENNIEICQRIRSNMKLCNLVILAFLTVQLALFVSGMGLCFGGGYPQCCANGKNSCGPLCASCSGVGEFLMNMRMFAMMGMGMGTPGVFRIINPDPHVIGAKRPGLFPAKPLPTNFRP